MSVLSVSFGAPTQENVYIAETYVTYDANTYVTRGLFYDTSDSSLYATHGGFVSKFTGSGSASKVFGKDDYNDGFITTEGVAATSAALNNANWVAKFGSDFYVTEGNGFVIRKFSNGVATTYAGTGLTSPNYVDIPRTSLTLDYPGPFAFDTAGK